MKREYRVKRADEFQSIIEKRKSDINQKFVIYHQVKREDHSRVGISVGKKLGNAVFRNKTKRQVRMMMQEIYKEDFSFDGVIIVRFKYFKSNYNDNLKDLSNLFEMIEKRRYSNEKL